MTIGCIHSETNRAKITTASHKSEIIMHCQTINMAAYKRLKAIPILKHL